MRSGRVHLPAEGREHEELHSLDGLRLEQEPADLRLLLRRGRGGTQLQIDQERNVGLLHFGGEGEAGDGRELLHPRLVLLEEQAAGGEEAAVEVVGGEERRRRAEAVAGAGPGDPRDRLFPRQCAMVGPVEARRGILLAGDEGGDEVVGEWLDGCDKPMCCSQTKLSFRPTTSGQIKLTSVFRALVLYLVWV